MSPQRCQYLHAMVMFEGEHLVDSALLICNQLLDAGGFGDDTFLEAEICELATNICLGCNRYIELLQYAHRGIALCHGRERLCSDEAAMLGRAGTAYQMLGQLPEAQQTFDHALELLADDHSFGGFVALISLQKKQAGLYRQTGDYDRVIAVCHQILAQVERFDRDPSFVDSRPTTMTESGDATHGFAGFYQTQMYAHLARAHRLKVEQGVSAQPQADRDSAAAYIDKWLLTDGSHSPRNMAFALRELFFTGRRAAFEAARQAAGESFGSDTLVIDYIEYLRILAEDAALRRDTDAQTDYLQRVAIINDSIRQHELLRTFSEQMSIYMVQEAQMAQKETEYKMSRNNILIGSFFILLIAGLVISVLFFIGRHHKSALEAAQHDLQVSKHELVEMEQQLVEAKGTCQVDNMTALYQRIEQVMTEEKLYLNPDLDVKMLVGAVGSSRTNISTCINNISGKNFRLWLSEYRLNLFVQMLKQCPDEPIEEIMIRCGYKEQSTLRRQFKAAYGMTAGEYRRRLLEEEPLSAANEQTEEN